MKNATLLFLVKRDGKRIADICLAMKKRGFGEGRWNGVGGKLNPDETVEQATIRETKEEISVEVSKLAKVAELTFTFANKPEWNQIVHVFTADEWTGEPAESEEMRPQWYLVSEIPFDKMWPDDIFWLPKVLEAELVRASFTLGDGDVILDQKVETVESL